jgi:diaminopimelate epimerase
MKGTLPFTKMHGTGNDFVVLDATRRSVRMTADLARRLCDRRFGAGADQVLLLEPSRRADLRMRIVNADGSEVEMCGNGIRCVARYAYERGLVRKKRMDVETLAGVMRPVLRERDVRVDMGPPVLDAAKVPTRAKGRVIDAPFRWRPPAPSGGKARSVRMTCVSMGNPHAVVFVDDLGKTPVEAWGPELETHPFFPKRTNVEFVQALDGRRAKVRVWERGAGLTLACGTGACAVGVAGALTGRTERHVFLELPGGTLEVEWAADGRVYLTGPAAFVYDGEFRMEKNNV